MSDVIAQDAPAEPRARVDITGVRGDPESFLARAFGEGAVELAPFAAQALIEQRARKTQEAGKLPLWEGYEGAYSGARAAREPARSSDQVRTRPTTGAFYYHLLRRLQPEVHVEFGTAFGVSGMYWLAALEDNGAGRLYTFDPNDAWRRLAVENLEAIGSRFTSVLGAFEAECDGVLPAGARIDSAFVDGIHTSAFVHPQVAFIKARMRVGGLIILDDIRFSKDMYACWSDLARRDDVRHSLEVGGRVGIIEFAGPGI